MKFRGINLPAKLPSYGQDPSIFYSQKQNVSFIDTPFPLKTAPEHFQRLANYGLNLLRLNVTWEAVMHQGPGIIDTNYLAYLSKLIDIASSFGLHVIIDPHQDVWSRFTGGDGMPWWTLDVAGFQTNNDDIHESEGAIVHHLHDTTKYPPAKMIWMTNYGKLATATMFTLFFAGDEYAQGIHVEEHYAKIFHQHFPNHVGAGGTSTGGNKVTMQQFLQCFYLQYFDVLAKLVKDKPNVIGFNTMNEPSNGYVGVNDLNKRSIPMPFGTSHSYFDGMKMGGGETLCREYYSAPFVFHSKKLINPRNKMAWKSLQHDIWHKVGVYDIHPSSGQRTLRDPAHFSLRGRDFIQSYMVPLFHKIQTTVSRHNPKFIIYAEPFIDVNDHHCPNAPTTINNNQYAWSPHWYDGATLLSRRYFEWLALDDEKELPVLTPRFIAWTFKRLLRHLKQTGNHKLHVVLGETGVPFDINNTNNYHESTKALNRIMKAIEANDLDFTLWNYYPNNTALNGDDWCGEDLSIRMTDRNRALLTLIRPFCYELCSDFQIVKQSFDPTTMAKKYTLAVRASKMYMSSSLSSLNYIFIYLPHFHYSNPLIKVSFGTWNNYDAKSQVLIWECSNLSLDDLGKDFMIEIENEH